MIEFQIRRTVLLGLKSLWLHRLRSMLTVLGMVFGVCSVIAMLAIGEGASHEAQEQIRRLGSANIIVVSVQPPEEQAGDSSQEAVAEYGLKYVDAERIANTIPGVEVSVPMRKIPKTVWHLGRQTDADVLGTVPWQPGVMGRQVANGRFLSSTDLHYATNVCVLDPEVAQRLFPLGGPLGKTVRVGGDRYRVVGVMERAAGAAAAGGKGRPIGAGNGVYIPLTTARLRFGELLMEVKSGSRQFERVELHQIVVRVRSADEVIETSRVLRAMLERFHEKEDYKLIVPLEQLRVAKRLKRTSDIVLGSIAAISLLVGGIGIMNIMLASITERTREIGIRRALGAKKRHIMAQFLTETVLLSGSGGVIGLALGVVIPMLVEHFGKMRTIITWWSPAVAFSISVGVGVIFGLYPAHRAAEMDPIEALRHE